MLLLLLLCCCHIWGCVVSLCYVSGAMAVAVGILAQELQTSSWSAYRTICDSALVQAWWLSAGGLSVIMVHVVLSLLLTALQLVAIKSAETLCLMKVA